MAQAESESDGSSLPLVIAEDGDRRFLTSERIREIGELTTPMIGRELSWIERRKESVKLLDDSSLPGRQISVDFGFVIGQTADRKARGVR